MSDKQSRTEQASQRKLTKSREQGQVAVSKDLTSTLALIMGMIMISKGVPTISAAFINFFKIVSSDFNYDWVSTGGMHNIIVFVFKSFATLALPIILTVWITTFVATVAQVGFHVSFKPLEPNFSKLNPVSGIQKLISVRGIIGLGISMTKMLVITLVTSSVLMNPQNTIAIMHFNEITLTINKLVSIVWELTFKAAITLLIIAVIDYSYQKWQFAEDQKMTKQEVKDEHKQQEGDPLIKGKVRSIQRAAAGRRGLKESVKEADVIVTNPFHIAVAIKYDRKKQNAPIIVAKGARLLAQRIREFAKESNIEIIQNIPLARALYKGVSVGFEIPPELYIAVAEVLAIVFKKREARV